MTKLRLKTLGLFLLAILFYWPHRYFLVPWFTPQLPLEFLNFGYLFNLIAAFIFVVITFIIAAQSKKLLAVLFVLYEAVKFAFFILFVKKFQFHLSKSVYIHFFLPYVFGIIIELYVLIQLLKDDKDQKISKL